jgi:hypothetical protein
VYLNRAWLGLRFLRALIFLSLPDILVYIRVINTSTSIRLAQLLCKFIAVVSVAAAQSGANLSNSLDLRRFSPRPECACTWRTREIRGGTSPIRMIPISASETASILCLSPYRR